MTQAIVNTFEQELFGSVHWRVMRQDWPNMIFGRHQTDFPTCEEAVAAVNGTFRRDQLGPGEIRIFGPDRQGGRALPKRVQQIS